MKNSLYKGIICFLTVTKPIKKMSHMEMQNAMMWKRPSCLKFIFFYFPHPQNFQSTEELSSLAAIDEKDHQILCKFDPTWFERKVIFESKMIMLKEIMKKIQMPGKVLCKICSEVLNYSSGGVKSIEVHCNTIRHKNNLRTHYKSLEQTIAKQQMLAMTNSSKIMRVTAKPIPKDNTPKQVCSIALCKSFNT